MIPSGGFPNLQIPMISSIPYLGNVLSNQNLLVYLTFTLAVAGEYFLYRNVFGIRLRAIGEYPEAAQSVGIDVTRYRFISILASGLFCGFAGSFLTLSGASMFSEGMTAGAGFIALAVVFFSQGRPLTMIFASLLFGYTESISVSLQQFKVPSQLMLMLPYLMTVVALTIISIVNQRKGRHEAAAD
jgi:simple sugar transport system permease protein